MRRLLILACAVVFLDVTFFSVLTPLLPSFKADHHLGEGATGVLAGSFAAGALAFAVPGGWMAARVGSRRTVIIGLAGIGVASPVFGFAGHIAVLDAARFLQGASGALMWAGAIAWVVSAAPKGRRGELIGTVFAAAVVGELCGAPLGALAHVIGTEVVFGAVFLIAVGLIVLALTVEPAADAVAGQGFRESIARMRGSVLPRALVMQFAPATAFGLIVVVAPLKMDELGGGAFVIAAAFACGSVVQAVLAPLIGRVSDRVGRTGPYFAGAMVVGVALVALGLIEVLGLLFAVVVAAAFGAGLAFTPAGALATEVASAVGINQGYASGWANVAWGGGQMIGAIGGGVIAGLTGFLVPCLIVAVFVLVIGMTGRVLTEPVLAATGEHPAPARAAR